MPARDSSSATTGYAVRSEPVGDNRAARRGHCELSGQFQRATSSSCASSSGHSNRGPPELSGSYPAKGLDRAFFKAGAASTAAADGSVKPQPFLAVVIAVLEQGAWPPLTRNQPR